MLGHLAAIRLAQNSEAAEKGIRKCPKPHPWLKSHYSKVLIRIQSILCILSVASTHGSKVYVNGRRGGMSCSISKRTLFAEHLRHVKREEIVQLFADEIDQRGGLRGSSKTANKALTLGTKEGIKSMMERWFLTQGLYGVGVETPWRITNRPARVIQFSHKIPRKTNGCRRS